MVDLKRRRRKRGVQRLREEATERVIKKEEGGARTSPATWGEALIRERQEKRNDTW